MKVRWFGHFSALSGYGRAARDYLLAMKRHTDVELEIVTFGGGVSPEPRYAEIDPLVVTESAKSLPPADIEVWHTSPDNLHKLAHDLGWQQSKTPRVAMTTWETDHMPEEYRYALRQFFRTTIVPSHFSADAIGDSVRHLIVPHCFDPNFWPRPVERPASNPYRFYSLGVWSERKNPLGVLRAYLHAFTKKDPVQLTMVLQGADFDAIRSLIARSGIPAAELPVLHIPDRVTLSERELVDFHDAGDCFVSATRGEGWGLGLFEAAIMGKYIICPNRGGQLDFLDEYHGTGFVNCSDTPCFAGEGRIEVVEQNGQRMAKMHHAMPPGVDAKQAWLEPDLEELSYRMGNIVGTPTRKEVIDDDRLTLDENFGYARIGPLLYNALKEIATT